MAFKEHARRSLAKALTFRSVVLVSDAIIIFFITHRVAETLSVLVLSNVASTLLFLGHERIWDKVQWGRRAHDKAR